MKLADLARGVTLGGRFRLQHILGRGSYGDVWLADVIDGADLPPQVALKIYNQPERGDRFLLGEAQTARAFENERLVSVFGAARLDGLFVMWMEYVDGVTLKGHLGTEDEPRPASLNDVMHWLTGIAEGLAYLHIQEPPFVHGDLKLENIILDRDANVRLLDFGQSKPIEDRFVETGGGGTLAYLAPETLGIHGGKRGRRYVASDIYAFGVLAYRVLTGRLPRATMPEILNLTPFQRPRELNARVPEPLEELVLKCLEKRPENRFQTGAELLAALQEAERVTAELKDAVVSAPETEPVSAVPLAVQLEQLGKELLDAGKPEDALKQLEKAIEMSSTSARLLLLYASAARGAGYLQAAFRVYERAIVWLENNGAPEQELRDPIEGRAEVEIALKKYDDAVTSYRWLAEQWPEQRWYRYRYAVALGLAGTPQASLDALLQLHEEGPPTATVCAKIGLAYLQLRDSELAAQYFNEALMLDEYEPVALFHLARIRAIEGRPDRARRYLDRLWDVEGASDQARELSSLIGESRGTQSTGVADV